MKKEIAEKWAAALISGGFIQVKERLSDLVGVKQGFCPLGVLCEISRLGMWHFGAYEITPNCYSFSHVPERVLKWSGLSEEGMMLIRTMGDTTGIDFPTIGKFILENYESL